MSETTKCANPVCTCAPPKGERFCGAHCEALKGAVEVMCQCGHASCSGDVLTASPAT
jgi:hypothetical protein